MSGLKIERDIINNDRNVFKRLKKETFPLYLWGIGNVAHEVYQMLSENGIKLTGVFIDVDVIERHDFKGYKVENLKDIIEKEEKINVIMGHAQYHKMKEIQSYSIVNCVYYILNPFKSHDDISEQYFYDHQEEFVEAYNMFAEDYSKKVFESYLNTRINSNIQYLLDVFEGPIDFFDNDVLKLNDHENYVDIGAYTGDTIKMFFKAVNGKYDTIYAFEPDEKFYRELEENVKMQDMASVNLYQFGVWNKDTTLFFEKDDEQSGKMIDSTTKGLKINVVSLDNILWNKNISLIKINLSAGNYEIIEGGQAIIQKLRPRLVVVIGLKKSDLFEIPKLLKEINSEYQFYLRYMESMPSRLTIFAM